MTSHIPFRFAPHSAQETVKTGQQCLSFHVSLYIIIVHKRRIDFTAVYLNFSQHQQKQTFHVMKFRNEEKLKYSVVPTYKKQVICSWNSFTSTTLRWFSILVVTNRHRAFKDYTDQNALQTLSRVSSRHNFLFLLVKKKHSVQTCFFWKASWEM